MRPTPGALDGAGRAVLGPYPSLREALAAATDGDEVRVRGGEYVERETLDVTCELAVVGEGEVILRRAGRGGTVLWLDAPQGRLANLSLAVGGGEAGSGDDEDGDEEDAEEGMGVGGVAVRSGRWALEGLACCASPDEPAVAVHQGAEARLYACRLRQCRTGLDALPGARAELTDCAVGPCRQFGVRAGPGARVALRGCSVRGVGRVGVYLQGGAAGEVEGPAPASCGEAPFKCDPGAALQRG
eukprot:tig00021254_g19733.t1